MTPQQQAGAERRLYEAKQQYHTSVIEQAKSMMQPKDRLLYLTEFGSTLYGTDALSSDIDYKGIFLPSVDSVILGTDKATYEYSTGDKGSKNTSDDIDMSLYSLQQFFKLISKGETSALDLLFAMKSDSVLYVEPRLRDILHKNLDKLLTKNTSAFVGYCMQQASKYGIKGSRYGEIVEFAKHLSTCSNCHQISTEGYKYIMEVRKLDKVYISVLGKLHDVALPIQLLKDRVLAARDQYGSRAKASKDGTDWKALSHALRVILELTELISTSTIKFPLAYAEAIKEVKYNTDESLLPKTLKDIKDKLDEVEELVRTSDLPQTADKEFLNHLLLSYYKKRAYP